MDDFWSNLLQELLLQFAPILAVAVVGYLLSVGRAWYQAFKLEQPEKAWLLERAVELAVKAAEQAGAVGYFESKKEYALDVAEKYLRENGVKVDLALIDAAIEAAVWDEFNKDKLKLKPTISPISGDTILFKNSNTDEAAQ